ncbi:MAG TPA: 16S rRNA (cytosine(1402)-N(4))-methyltransferase RsmH [Holophagaceae bacterium]|nr:16S rRNA (cytosine(1402)-N(4))-methyltransferase RsmH [Holophagaceae bacterium]
MMVATPIHIPVLLNEVLDTLVLPPGARILDLTLGLGGHAEALLRRCDGDSRYMGVDRDPEARALAQARLGHDPRLSVIASTYEDLWRQPEYQKWTERIAPDGYDAILADLGVSSLQLKSASRGFSFREQGPLDMRMDTESGMTAYEWIQRQDEGTLAFALRTYGEERLSKPIARSILAALRDGRLATTLDLAEAVYKVIPKEPAKRKGHADPATRTFQAIRIAVNGELERLAVSLEEAVRALRPGGRLAVISFHSLEDRIVKQTFRRLAGIYDGPNRVPPEPLPKIVKLVHPGGLEPSEAELAANPPSRSARLRAAERLS